MISGYCLSQSNRAQGLSAGARALPGYLPESAGSALDTDPGHVPSSDLMDEKEDERSVSPSRSASCPPDSADLAEVDAPITPTNGSKRDKRSEKDGLSKFKEEPAAQYAADTHRGPAVGHTVQLKTFLIFFSAGKRGLLLIMQCYWGSRVL